MNFRESRNSYLSILQMEHQSDRMFHSDAHLAISPNHEEEEILARRLQQGAMSHKSMVPI